MLVSCPTGGHMWHHLQEQCPHLWQQMLHSLHPQFSVFYLQVQAQYVHLPTHLAIALCNEHLKMKKMPM